MPSDPPFDARLWIVVPAFNEERVITDVVTSIRVQYANVLVVDDGSSDATADRARRAGAIVLRHLINRGQGAALQTGLTHALRNDAQCIVTFDADGQHRADDIRALISPIRHGVADVVFGSRFLESETEIPFFRRFLLRTATRFTRLVSSLPVTDTHNGLRAFSRSAAAKVDIRLDRMAHASELIDQVAAMKVRFMEVPVRVAYTSYSRWKGQRSTHALRILFDYLVGRWSR